MRFVAMVFVALMGWTAEADATLILVYRSSDAIIIAADSLRTIRTDPPRQVHVCKIRNFGDVVFAASGTSYLRGPLSLDAITAELHRATYPVFWDRIKMFDYVVDTDFKKVHSRRVTTAHREKLEPEILTFEYILGFILDGRLVALTRRLTSSRAGVDFGTREVLSVGAVLPLGQPDILDHLSDVDLPDGADNTDLATLFTATINHQAQRMPTKVGGHVDIIRLAADGAEWLQRKDQCAAQEARPRPAGPRRVRKYERIRKLESWRRSRNSRRPADAALTLR